MSDIQVGDWVRSYDFANRQDCYVEGTVKRIDVSFQGIRAYEIDVEKRVIGGVSVQVSRPFIVYPPMNGTPTIAALNNGSDKTDFVHKVEKA